MPILASTSWNVTENRQKLFTLGPRVLNIGFAFLTSKDIIEIAGPELEALRDETQVSAHLAIRDGRDVLYLNCVQTRSGFLSNMNVGARVTAHASPMGWLLLSDLPAEEPLELYRDAELARLTDETPGTAQALARLVSRAGRDGHVISRGVMEAGGSSVCAPVRNRAGRVEAAIDVSGPVRPSTSRRSRPATWMLCGMPPDASPSGSAEPPQALPSGRQAARAWPGLATISSTCASLTMKGGASSTWTPRTPSALLEDG